MLPSFVRPAVAFLKNEDGPTAVEYAVMLALDHRGVHHRHHDPGQQRQQHLQLRRQPNRRRRVVSPTPRKGRFRGTGPRSHARFDTIAFLAWLWH